MIFADEIPELNVYSEGFPGFWVGLMFTQTFDERYAARALVTNFVRHVEGAFKSYREGRKSALKFIHRDAAEVPLFAFLNASSEFERCIVDVHRAIRCMGGIIRNRDVPQGIRDLFSPRPTFLKTASASCIRNVRDAVHHTYEMIGNGEIRDDSPFVLAIDGPEVPASESDQPGQVLKTFDRLRIGSFQITFEKLNAMLEEMGGCAQRLAEYEPT